MQQIIAVHGPPGTGKTHYLTGQADRAAQVHGPFAVGIVSLTKTAAAEVKSRVESIPSDNVGTLHSICFRLLGMPRIATGKALLEWNEAYPHWALPVSEKGIADADDPLAQGANTQAGEALMQRVELNRHRRVPPELWLDDERHFHKLWSDFKREAMLYDFTDLIETVANEQVAPPAHWEVLIADEAQDLSALENEVISLWATRMKTTVVAGDADQWLYSWRGADPVMFKPNALPPEHIRLLAQSFRVPQAAHAEALDLIRQCSNRIDNAYRPTDVVGRVERGLPSFRAGGSLIDLAESCATAEKPEGNRLMFLAPCGFSLDPIIGKLREKGIPYANRFRTRNGKWNPLQKRANTVSMGDRILAFTSLSRTGLPWNREQLRAWAQPLNAELVFKRGVKGRIEKDEDFVVPKTLNDLRELLREPGEAERIVVGDVGWFEARMTSAEKERAKFPVAIYRRVGPRGLQEDPRITVGTIHSVKGGEADQVVISPDLSDRGMSTLAADKDSIRRMFYVGMTRTRDTLFLCTPSHPRRHGAFW